MRREGGPALVMLGVVLGAALVLSSWLVVRGLSYIKTFSETQLEVTGSAERVVRSDRVKWVAAFARSTSPEAWQTGFDLMAADLDAILAVLGEHGITRDDLSIAPVTVIRNVSNCYNQGPECVPRVTGFDFQQSLTLASEGVDEVTALAQDVRPFVDRGVAFQTQGLEYFYSRLAEARPELLADATRDAQARAVAVAGSTGATVGALQSVDSGVFQVTQVNSVDVESYGAYDTSTIEKRITAVVHARFALRP